MRIQGLTGQLIQQYIVEALLQLMEQEPYEKISIGQITKRAGVNRSSYYRHFNSKEDILRFYLLSIMEEYQQKFQKGADHSFSGYTHQIFVTFYQHRADLLRIHKSGLSYLLLDVLNQCFRFNGAAGQMALEKQFEISYHIGGIYNNLRLWMDHNMAETPEQMTQIALSFKPEGSFTLLDVKEEKQ